MIRLFIVRHGRTAWNAAGRFTGQADPPLDAVGRRQAAILAEILQGIPFTAALTSDLRRVRETAEIILTGRGLSPVSAPRLREASFGEWEGLTYAEIAARDRERLKSWEADPPRTPPPGGESLEELAARLGTLLAELSAGREGQNVLLVTHGGPARVLLCLTLGVPLERHWRFGLANGGLAVLEFYEGEGILVELRNPVGPGGKAGTRLRRFWEPSRS
ncbi:MAG: histidine phosphatase family protein [Firmicutes bacterium]|nr:histidine phosphatase family protein [Bacillota bacterium]